MLDVELSGYKSGIDVATEIRKYSKIPLLFLTSCADPISQKKTMQFEPKACIEKAFYKQDILSLSEVVLQDSSTQKELLDFLTKREFKVLKLIKEGYTTR